ncbi:MAG: GNAT family N-acetyltransferase [Acidobacteriota bacterium]
MSSISDTDLTRLATLHATSLDGSLFARLGTRLLERYYRFVVDSEDEALLLERDDSGGIRGAAVLSFAPLSLTGRFVGAHVVGFGIAMLRGMLTDGAVRGLLFHYARERLKGVHATIDDGTPEVLQIYIDPTRRGGGIGSKLMRRAERVAYARGARSMAVRTEAEDNEPVLRFYDRGGYRRRGESVFCGVRYIGFVKDRENLAVDLEKTDQE